LKKAYRVWYSKIDEYLISVGFNRSPSEPTLYKKVNWKGKILIVCLYVDDLIFTGDLSVDDFKDAMKIDFEMTNLGLMSYFLGIEVDQSDDGIFICQTNYANEVLKRYRMLNCKPTAKPMATGIKLCKYDEGSYVDPTLYRRMVGSLMYLTTTKPDIMFVVTLISRFMETPKSTVRKTGPRSNKIKQMQKQNTEDTQYKRDTDLRGSPSVGYVHQRNCQVLPLLLSSK
jgi:hypothetical protein